MSGEGKRPLNVHFIINPIAGGGAAVGRLIMEVHTYRQKFELSGEVRITLHRGHARELAQRAVATGCTHVVAIGGDGTVNEVAAALAGQRVALVVLPRGSGNGLARHLGLPKDLVRALDGLTEGKGQLLPMDTGQVNGRFFCNVMGFGFDAALSQRFLSLRHRGLLGYVCEAWAEFAQRKSVRFGIHTMDASPTRDALLVSIANSGQYGYNAQIAPGASVRDGHLDLVCIKPVSLLGAARLVFSLFRGTLASGARLERRQTNGMRIIRTESGLIHTDGEVHHEDAELEIVVKPKSLLIYVPPAAARHVTSA